MELIKLHLPGVFIDMLLGDGAPVVMRVGGAGEGLILPGAPGDGVGISAPGDGMGPVAVRYPTVGGGIAPCIWP